MSEDCHTGYNYDANIQRRRNRRKDEKSHPGMQQDYHRGDRKDVVGENALSEALWASLTRFKLLDIKFIG